MNWEFLLYPLVAAIGGFLVWLLQSRLEAIRSEREQLHETRRAIYMRTLQPYIRLLTYPDNKRKVEEAAKQVTSYEHRKALLEISFMGSDEVVRALNKYMQHAYHSNSEDLVTSVERLCELFLAIRKDLGNKETKLLPIDMLRSQIRDIDQYMGNRT